MLAGVSTPPALPQPVPPINTPASNPPAALGQAVSPPQNPSVLAAHTPSKIPSTASSHTTVKPSPNPPTTPRPVTPPAQKAKHPNLPVYAHQEFEYTSLALPSGPLYSLEGFLDRISASTAFDAATNAPANPAVTVAIIDTGFALNHEILADRWATNAAESGAAATDGIDNDADGFIDNYLGWDFVHGGDNPAAGVDNPASTAATHGTLTAGLATLLSPTDKILPLQALNDNGSGYTDDIAAAVRYAADHGAKIISLSLGTAYDDPYLRDQIDYALSKGSLVLAAAGNTGCNCMLYPAAYPEVVAVGSSTSSDLPATASSYGSALDILAPGTAVDVCSSQYVSSGSTTSYTCSYSGTSLATPIVAGLAALLSGQCPSCSAAALTAAIESGADAIAGMTSGIRTDTTGFGRINAYGAVTALNTALANDQPGDINGDLLVNVYDLSLLLTQWLSAGPSAELNTDGIVNVYDLSIMLSHWMG